jgi:hypothetical protein
MLKSTIWLYFDKIDGRNAKCKTCVGNKNIKINRNTSNLWEHLKRCHSKKYRQVISTRNDEDIIEVRTESPSESTVLSSRSDISSTLSSTLSGQQTIDEIFSNLMPLSSEK